MARTRNIKPGFFMNEELAECDPLARLLFAGLWTIADREGRLEDRPKRIKAEILPYDNAPCELLLAQLAKHGFIVRYCAAGEHYIQITKFLANQNPHVNEAPSSIPAPTEPVSNKEEYDTSTIQAPEEYSTNPALTQVTLTDYESQIMGDAVRPSSEPAPIPFKKPKKEPEAPATSFPASFAVTGEMEAWAKKHVPDLDIEVATEQWSDAMRANRTKYRYTDWVLAWYNGMRNAAKWNTGTGGNGNGNYAQGQVRSNQQAGPRQLTVPKSAGAGQSLRRSLAEQGPPAEGNGHRHI